MKTIMAEINVSEGRNIDTIEEIKAAVLKDNKVTMVDLNYDSDHNRSVFTFKGSVEDTLEAAKRLVDVAFERIDMTTQHGSHPRQGAVDVAAWVPVKDMSTDEMNEVVHEFGKYIGSKGVPVFYYEDSATREDRKSLVKLRKGEYESLEERLKDAENWTPDEGERKFNAKLGATVTGTRFPLIAFNVYLNTEDMDIAKAVMRSVRAKTGGYTAVRAIALPIEDQKCTQVSMNLVNYELTPIHRVFETIKSEAESYGVTVKSSELVGPVPAYALEELLRFYIRLGNGFTADQIYN